jgi:hypothetical protein
MIKEPNCPEFSIINKFAMEEWESAEDFFSLEITVTMGNYLSAREKTKFKTPRK